MKRILDMWFSAPGEQPGLEQRLQLRLDTGGADKSLLLGLSLFSGLLKTIEQGPIDLILFCPSCNQRHIEPDDMKDKPHGTHACQHCGFCWRPANVNTRGVAFLPGFKSP